MRVCLYVEILLNEFYKKKKSFWQLSRVKVFKRERLLTNFLNLFVNYERHKSSLFYEDKWNFFVKFISSISFSSTQTLFYHWTILLFLYFFKRIHCIFKNNCLHHINSLIIFRMVLMVQGVVQDEPPSDTRTLYLNHPVLRDSASQLLTISTKVIGPIGLLYVCQREMAVTVPHDSKYDISSIYQKQLIEKSEN